MTISLLAPGSREEACRLLRALRVSLAAVNTPQMHRAICSEAIRNPRLVFVVAHEGEELAGMAIATIRTASFWKRLLLRHPLLAARVIVERVLGRIRRPTPAAGVALDPFLNDLLPSPNYRWSDERSDLAKVSFIGVSEQFRRTGLGRQLYSALFEELRQRGAHLVYAHVEVENESSISLHQKTGWKLFREGDKVLAVYDLSEHRAEAVPGASV